MLEIDKSEIFENTYSDEDSVMSRRWYRVKQIFLFCVLFLFLHIALTISMSGQQNILDDIEEGGMHINGDNNEVEYEIQSPRKKRDIADDVHHDKPSADGPTFNQLNTMNNVCSQGHAQDIISQCEGNQCLKKQTITESRQKYNITVDRDISKGMLRDLQRSKGRFSMVHLNILSAITELQWTSGIYGSVAIAGDVFGHMTKLVLTYTDDKSSEKVFIVEPSFFSTESSEEYKSSSFHFCKYSNFSKQYFINQGASQFRLVSLNVRDNLSILPRLLRQTVCIVRDGAVVVLDNTGSEANDILKHFYQNSSDKTIKPFLATDSRIYLSGPRWRPIYKEVLLKTLPGHIHLQNSQDNIYTNECLRINNKY